MRFGWAQFSFPRDLNLPCDHAPTISLAKSDSATKTCYGLSALFKNTALTQAFGLGWYVTAPLALIRLTWRHLRTFGATTKTPAGVPEGQRPLNIPAWANGP